MSKEGGQDEGSDLDLFGEPVLPIRDPRGRPAYAKSKENQLLVITLRGAGWSQEDIATHMGCDPKTLRKHFSRELDAGALMLEGMALQVLVQKMREGSIPAAKEVHRIASTRAPRAGRPAKPAPLGKKAERQAAAQEVPHGWGDLIDRRMN